MFSSLLVFEKWTGSAEIWCISHCPSQATSSMKACFLMVNTFSNSITVLYRRDRLAVKRILFFWMQGVINYCAELQCTVDYPWSSEGDKRGYGWCSVLCFHCIIAVSMGKHDMHVTKIQTLPASIVCISLASDTSWIYRCCYSVAEQPAVTWSFPCWLL